MASKETISIYANVEYLCGECRAVMRPHFEDRNAISTLLLECRTDGCKNRGVVVGRPAFEAEVLAEPPNVVQ